MRGGWTIRRLPPAAAIACALAAVAVFAWAFAASAQAGTIAVSTTFDELDGAPDATCSLREAVQTANGDVDAGGCTDANSAAADAIVLGGGEYDLTIPGDENANVNGDLDTTGTVTIQGAGAAATGIDANGGATADRAVHALANSVLTLSGLTIHDGAGTGTGSSGGGVRAESPSTLNLSGVSVIDNTIASSSGTSGGGISGATVNLADSTVSDNFAGLAGGGISAANVNLTNSTVSGNRANNNGGGGILASGTATLVNSEVRANSTTGDTGGGIQALTVDLTDSAVSENVATNTDGGGIEANSVALTRSSVIGNTAGGDGGGISGSVDMTDSTVSRNEAGGDGGGVFDEVGAMAASRSTIVGNDAVGDGGGVFYDGFGTFNLTNSTVSGNSALGNGGGIRTDSGTTNLRNATINRNIADSAPGNGINVTGTAAVNLRNTILAGNAGASPDCQGTLTSEGRNLFGNTASCTIVGVTTGNVTNPNPGVALLANNGGPTLTHGLLAGSPALNAGYPGSGPGQPCETTDQRGQPRGGAAGQCDIGAFEAQAPPTAPPATNDIVVTTTFDDFDGGGAGNPCSLREAVRFANDDLTTGGCADANNVVGDTDTIVLAGGSYDLTRIGGDDTNVNGDLDITDDLVIQGAGAAATGIDANGALTASRALQTLGGMPAPTLSLSGLTVHDGTVTGNGGGISASGNVNLTDSAVSDNSAGGVGGGGVFASDVATLTGTTVSGNTATTASSDGGGVWADQVALTTSTVRDNISGDQGGGVYTFTDVDLTNSTVSGNTAATQAGGVYEGGGGTVTDSAVTGNTAGTFGGGLVGAPTELTGSTLQDNTAGTVGGGLWGPAEITNSTVNRNEAGTDGGGVFTDFFDLTVSRSTIAGNDALDDGGGVFYTTNFTFNLTNSTVSGNSANGDAGGINTADGTINLRNATINGNVGDADSVGGGAVGGLLRGAGTDALNVRNTILAGNAAFTGGIPDCGTSGTLNSEGYNLFGSVSGCAISGVTTGNVTNPNPGVALLANNGGPTLTHGLLAGSPALNAGYPGSGPGQPCETTDQRGQPRGGAAGQCDIGAFEAQPSPPSGVTPAAPATPPKKCKKGRKLKKGKCVKKKRRGKSEGETGMDSASSSRGADRLRIRPPGLGRGGDDRHRQPLGQHDHRVAGRRSLVHPGPRHDRRGRERLRVRGLGQRRRLLRRRRSRGRLHRPEPGGRLPEGGRDPDRSRSGSGWPELRHRGLRAARRLRPERRRRR